MEKKHDALWAPEAFELDGIRRDVKRVHQPNQLHRLLVVGRLDVDVRALGVDDVYGDGLVQIGH